MKAASAGNLPPPNSPVKITDLPASLRETPHLSLDARGSSAKGDRIVLEEFF
jgi:hypothetical protein